MKTFSKEKLILEHYVKAAEEVMDEVTVRVWKPKTMQKLPAVCMRGVMQSHRRSALSARDIYLWRKIGFKNLKRVECKKYIDENIKHNKEPVEIPAFSCVVCFY